MGIKVTRGIYKDIPSVIVTTSKLKVTFLPSQGGKMTSLVFLESGRDYLEQRDEETYRRLGVDSVYTQAECAAYDDMFPTIDPWAYEEGPLKGKPYLDHGEVSRMPQLFTVCEDAVYTYMRSAILPYTFEKKITENARGGLRIDYKATNLADFEYDFLWAAHFMACAEKGGRVVSPYPADAKVEMAFATDAALYGKRNDIYALPYGPDGKTRLDENGAHDVEGGNAWKYYYSDPLPEGWLGYTYPSDGTTVRFTFDEKKVPYAGVWMNNGGGGLGNFFNAALEVCTASFDRPDTARARKQHSVLPASGKYEWFVEFDIVKGK